MAKHYYVQEEPYSIVLAVPYYYVLVGLCYFELGAQRLDAAEAPDYYVQAALCYFELGAQRLDAAEAPDYYVQAAICYYELGAQHSIAEQAVAVYCYVQAELYLSVKLSFVKLSPSTQRRAG